MKKLSIGDRAPLFRLEDQDGKPRELSRVLGQWTLIYFYPKDFTPGCTLEGCELRDHWEELKKHSVAVIGISADSVERHRRFAAKYRLPFILLADPGKRALRAYGVWGKKHFLGRSYLGIHRRSFLLDANGRIVKIYEKVKPLTHASDVLRDVGVLGEKAGNGA